jgi:hypothetical protein
LTAFAGFFSETAFDTFAGPVDFAAAFAGFAVLAVGFATGFDEVFAGFAVGFALAAGFATILVFDAVFAAGLAAVFKVLAAGFALDFPFTGLAAAFELALGVALAGFAVGLAATFFAVGFALGFAAGLAAGLADVLATDLAVALFAAGLAALFAGALAGVLAVDLVAATGLAAFLVPDLAAGALEDVALEDDAFTGFAAGFEVGLAAGFALLAEGVMILLSVVALDPALSFDLEKPKEPRKPRFFESSCCFAIGASCRQGLNQ